MNITQIRNATILIEMGEYRILVDPMLSPASSLPGFRFFRGQRRKNPLTELPEGTDALINSATHVLITHEHPDHLDPPGVEWVKSRSLPVWASSVDAPNLKRKGLDAKFIGETSGVLSVEVISVIHGYGVMGWLMGPVAGYYIFHPDEPTILVTGDTVLTASVREAIERLQPHVIVAPAGTANFGIGKDLMFSESELVELVKLAPGQVLFNHLESIDHCLMTRSKLHDIMTTAGLDDRVLIPADGERIVLTGLPDIPHVRPGKSEQVKPGFQKWLTAKFAGT